jgi:predicted MFS family arabinose efflux permease
MRWRARMQTRRSSRAIVPELIPRDEVLEAVALNSMQFNIARGVGPAIGGIIVSALGAGLAPSETSQG